MAVASTSPQPDDDGQRPRVLVVADDLLAQAGLAAVLTERGVTVAAQVASTDDLAAQASLFQPDALVWDLGWEAAPALERLTELGDDLPPVLALLSELGDAHVAWAAGVRGLLRRTAGHGTLASAVAAVAQGTVVLDPEIARTLAPTRQRPLEPPADPLTPRELEVLRLLAEGLTNKVIAELLGISEHTIKFHVNALMGKLDAGSRTEAVTRATRLGLLLL